VTVTASEDMLSRYRRVTKANCAVVCVSGYDGTTAATSCLLAPAQVTVGCGWYHQQIVKHLQDMAHVVPSARYYMMVNYSAFLYYNSHQLLSALLLLDLCH